MNGKLLLLASVLLVLPVATPRDAAAQSLRGSLRSMDLQNRVAQDHGFTFIRTSNQVRRFVEEGYLVRVLPTRDYDLHAVSFPYARPEVALFIQRLAGQYREGCGEKLVVTSLTRPRNLQPRNASRRSVHPTGMAVDLRRSSSRACRAWLERVLLDLEAGGVLEATRERYPAHYHIALFPKDYAAYVEHQGIPVEAALEATVAQAPTLERVQYRVRRGDSLWAIARRMGTTVEALRAENGLRSSRIYAGQVIEVPVYR